jgi:ribonuclease P protein component
MSMRRLRLPRAGFEHLAASPAARRFGGLHFSILTAQNMGGLAVVVSKKVARKSVDRHKLKRRIREALHELGFPGLNQSAIVYARPGSSPLPYAVLRQELAGILRLPKPSDTL